MAINLKTGKQKFELNFDEEYKREIWFNPCDPDLAIRMSECEGKIKERTANLPDLELNEKGEPVDEAAIEVYKAYRKIVDEEIDRAFNANVSATLFEFCSPFADVGDGTLFFVHFMEAITPEVQQRVASSNEQKLIAFQKHLKKYGCGKK